MNNNAGDVDELRGGEGGRWRVHTQGDSHVIDLDKLTVTREPGVDQPVTYEYRERQLISIEWCKVGEMGFWRMVSADPGREFWHRTSTIRRIERISSADDAP
jgi:hypothetical protein